jgi:hypothetical protein
MLRCFRKPTRTETRGTRVASIGDFGEILCPIRRRVTAEEDKRNTTGGWIPPIVELPARNATCHVEKGDDLPEMEVYCALAAQDGS